MAGQFASRLSLLAFAVLIVRGLMTGSDFQGTLQWALLVTFAFLPFGYVMGELARRLIEENARLEFHRLREPKPAAVKTPGA